MQQQQQAQQEEANAQFLEMIKEDLNKVKAEFDENNVPEFLKYLLENYVPEDKKFELTEDMLSIAKIKRTILQKFTIIFHPDKNVNEE